MEAVTRDQVKAYIEGKSGPYILIDVRQPEELVHGVLPTAQNLPIDEVEEAFALPDDAFLRRYRFPKPEKDAVVIFYCRTGGRSARATTIAKEKGYVLAVNYAGSVYDWSEIDPNVKTY